MAAADRAVAGDRARVRGIETCQRLRTSPELDEVAGDEVIGVDVEQKQG